MRKVPKPFNIVFDPATQPGHQTRYGISLDRFTSGANIRREPIKLQRSFKKCEPDLRKFFNSQTAPQTLPSSLAKRNKA